MTISNRLRARNRFLFWLGNLIHQLAQFIMYTPARTNNVGGGPPS